MDEMLWPHQSHSKVNRDFNTGEVTCRLCALVIAYQNRPIVITKAGELQCRNA